MIADLISGEVDVADFMFLIAAILSLLAAFVRVRVREYEPVLGWLGLSAVAIGLLVL